MKRVEKVGQVVAALEGHPVSRGFAMAPRRPNWISRLFPKRYAERPDSGYYMSSYVHAHLDWRDRLRVLVSGRVAVEIITETDVMVSTAKSTAAVWVRPPGSAW